jgi:hypothetical protein
MVFILALLITYQEILHTTNRMYKCIGTLVCTVLYVIVQPLIPVQCTGSLYLQLRCKEFVLLPT